MDTADAADGPGPACETGDWAEALTGLDRALEAARTADDGADRARSRAGRRAQGAFFTPVPLARFVAAQAIEARFAAGPVRWRDDGSPELRVADPAAGDGRFLRAALAHLAERARRQGYAGPAVRRAIARRCLLGVERDPAFADSARAALGGEAPVHCAESLLAAPAELADLDVVLGNPPYLRSIRFADADRALWEALRGRYRATSHGEWDLYAAFLEQSLDWCGRLGQVGLVVPSRWMTAAFAAPLRAKLGAAAAVRAIVDFGARQLFADATTYVSVVFLSRLAQPTATVARLHGARWEVGQLANTDFGRAPWRLSVGRRRGLIEHLAAAGPTLGQVARIAKGTGTNADPVYLLERAVVRDDGLVEGISRAAGERVAVERVVCQPCVRGRDVTAFGRIDGALQCVLPYDADGRLWSPAELRERAPRAAAYLERLRRRLEERERGRYRDATYYRHGRPQNLAFLLAPAPKVVVPDVAREGRALADEAGALVLDSAYAIRPRDAGAASVWLLLAILNSPVVGLWLRETGVPLRGGYTRLKTAYLEGLPVPGESAERRALEEAAARAHRDGRIDRPALDDLVRRAYRLEAAAWADWLTG